MPNQPTMPSEIKGMPILTSFPVNGSFYIGIYQGSLSPYDIIIRYRQKENGIWSRPRTPKHVHWAVDILIKQYQDSQTTDKLLVFLTNLWDKQISPWTTEEERLLFIDPERLMADVNKEAPAYSALAQKGEYSIKFLILLAKLLMAQEKTNRNDAYMFRSLLEQLRNHENIFRIISTATFR